MLCIQSHIHILVIMLYAILQQSRLNPKKVYWVSSWLSFYSFYAQTHIYLRRDMGMREISIYEERKTMRRQRLTSKARTLCHDYVYIYIIYLCMSKWIKSTLHRTIKTEFNFQKVLSRSYYTLNCRMLCM